MKSVALATFVLLVTAVSVSAAQAPAAPAPAQTPPAPPAGQAAPPAGRGAAPAATPAPAPAAEAAPLEPQGYTYKPEGRRDPFVSLVRRGAEIGAPDGARPPGLAGMTAAEVVMKGTYQGRSREWVAMLQGTDNKTYLAKAGDKLLDGTVRTVTKDSMVILQRVNDPLSLETTREVRKMLRQTEEAK
jgi:hypothetical protein